MRLQAVNIREAFAHPGPPCNATAYAPSRVYFKAHPVYGECEIVFVMGDRYGWIYPELPEKPAATLPLTHPQRFADRINAFIRDVPYTEKWYPLGIVLDKNDVPWMGKGRERFLDPEFALRSQPEICVGSFATPSVVLVGDVLHMFVCATVADPNITTGANDMRPPSGPTPYGPRGSYNGKPLWSYFVMYHYRSFTGLRGSWAIVNYANDVEHNVALQHAVAYFEPREQDRVFGHGAEFQGIGGCSAIHVPADTCFYVSFGFSTSQWAKSGMIRVGAIHGERAIYDTTKGRWEAF
jgi:hypothetical protein